MIWIIVAAFGGFIAGIVTIVIMLNTQAGRLIGRGLNW